MIGDEMGDKRERRMMSLSLSVVFARHPLPSPLSSSSTPPIEKIY